MIRSFFRRGLRLGFVVGALLFVVQVFLRRQSSPQPADTVSDRERAGRPARPEPRPADATGNRATAASATTPQAEPASATSAPLAEATGAGTAVAAKAAPEPAPTVTEPAPAAKARKATKSAKATKAAGTGTGTAKAGKAKKAAKAGKKKAAAPARLPAWVDPVDGGAPATHPVKAKVSSKIYHLPGMTAYDRTTPDRCYRDAQAAEADGFRKAQR